jgi:recombination protein RecT
MAVTSGNADLKNKLVTKATGQQLAAKPKTVYDLINAMKPEIARALPKHMDADRLLRIAVTAIRVNPKLQLCTQESLLAGVMTSAQLGLEPNTPLQQAFLIPYNNNVKVGDKWQERMDVQFQLGYQGVLDLAYRTAQYKDIYAEGVYSKDVFEYRLGLNRDLIHEPCEDEDKGDLTHVYAVYHTKNGGFDFKVWTVARIRKHAKQFSKSYEKAKGAWQASDASFLGMCKKTVLLDLLKYGPKSIEYAKQLSTDETIKHDIAVDMTDVPAIDVTYEVSDEGEEEPQPEGENQPCPERLDFLAIIDSYASEKGYDTDKFKAAMVDALFNTDDTPVNIDEALPAFWKDLIKNFSTHLPKIEAAYKKITA